jgi:LysM repeat protein
MKKSILLAILIFSQVMIYAQDELIVRQSEKGLYLSHTVAPKESFYSIGRLYNVAPKDIASFNDIDMNKGLSIDQKIMIPLNGTNFSQKNNKGRAVYYVVGQKEGLYRVSVKNNDVLMADIRKWNRLNNDNIAAGQKLIVGFLISTEADKIVASSEADKQEQVEEPNNQVVYQEPPVEKKEEIKKQTEPKRNDPEPKKEVKQDVLNNNNGGYFKSHFDLQVRSHPIKKDETASAGIFKTASGWQDGKYYALMDGVEPGTIIRIVNPTNSKAVYAKILGPMSGIRQNQGYDVRLSNAAASALEVTDTDKFIVKVNY